MALVRHDLKKFAEAAFDILEKNGEKFSQEDIVKVASFLLQTKIDREKVAEFNDQGRIMARLFYSELDKMGGVADKIIGVLSKVHGKVQKGVTAVGKKLVGKKLPTNDISMRLTTGQRLGTSILKNRKRISTGIMAGTPVAALGAAASTD